jgi:hypothetical protein
METLNNNQTNLANTINNDIGPRLTEAEGDILALEATKTAFDNSGVSSANNLGTVNLNGTLSDIVLKTYSDNQLQTAKNYSDTNLQTAKDYSDTLKVEVNTNKAICKISQATFYYSSGGYTFTAQNALFVGDMALRNGFIWIANSVPADNAPSITAKVGFTAVVNGLLALVNIAGTDYYNIPVTIS